MEGFWSEGDDVEDGLAVSGRSKGDSCCCLGIVVVDDDDDVDDWLLGSKASSAMVGRINVDIFVDLK